MRCLCLLLCVLALFSSCKESEKDKIARLVEEWEGKEILFPARSVFTIQGKDTVNFSFVDADYKVVTYIDSVGCTSCKLQLPRWKLFMQEVDSTLNRPVPFAFYFHPKDMKELRYITCRDAFVYPVCFDEMDDFNQLNHFPGEMTFQTFLLDKDNKVVFLYATDAKEQYTYIETAKGKGYDVLLMDGQLDTHFINHLEQKNSDHRFVRVDSDVIDKLIPKEETKEVALSHEEQEELRAVFTSQLPKEEGMFMVNFEAMGENGDPVIVTRSEFMRRMKEMAAMNPGMGFYGAMGDQYTLVVNTDHKLVNAILENEKEEMSAQLEPINFEIKETEKKQAELDELNKGKKDEEIPQVDKDRKSEYSKTIADLNKQKNSLLEEYGKGNKVVGQLIDLALLANGLLKGEALNRFVKRSVELIK